LRGEVVRSLEFGGNKIKAERLRLKAQRKLKIGVRGLASGPEGLSSGLEDLRAGSDPGRAFGNRIKKVKSVSAVIARFIP
jgi:hypothetical protein